MGLFSSSDSGDEGRDVFEDRTDVTQALGQATSGDEFTLRTVDGLILGFEVDKVKDGMLYGECEVMGPHVIKIGSGTVHGRGENGVKSVGHGIERLEVEEMDATLRI